MIKNPVDTALETQLDYLKLPFLKEHCRPLAAEATAKHWSHLDYLARLIEGEAAAHQDRTIRRRIQAARFPVIKTLDTFRWDWPKKINQLQVQDLFRLRFLEDKANAIFLGLCRAVTHGSHFIPRAYSLSLSPPLWAGDMHPSSL